MKTFLKIAGGIILAMLFVWTLAGPAHATDPVEDQPYVLVAWKVPEPSTVESPWVVPQELYLYSRLTVPSLDALDAKLECGTTYQIDLYYAGEVTDALIAGGLLYGPNNPPESLAYVLGDGINPWKFIVTADCVVVEPPIEEPPVVVPPVDTPVTVDTPTPTLAATGSERNSSWIFFLIAAICFGAALILRGRD